MDVRSDDTLDDADLLVLSVHRPEAFVAFYERHAEALLRFFARRTMAPDAAAELTAETFAQTYASRGRFSPEGGDAGAWLYGIARHQLSRYFRLGAVDARARRRFGMPAREASSEDVERIERLADLPALRATVADALETVPEGERRAVALRVIDERTYAEVAAELGCSEQAARARVSRGLRRLGRVLEPEREALLDGGWIG